MNKYTFPIPSANALELHSFQKEASKADNETGESLMVAHRAPNKTRAMASTSSATTSALARRGSGAKKRPHSPDSENVMGTILSQTEKQTAKRSAIETDSEGCRAAFAASITHDIVTNDALGEPGPVNILESTDRGGAKVAMGQLVSNTDRRGNTLLTPEVVHFFREMMREELAGARRHAAQASPNLADDPYKDCPDCMEEDKPRWPTKAARKTHHCPPGIEPQWDPSQSGDSIIVEREGGVAFCLAFLE
ncbi:UNVERIFIED_CONTAM: hypothetical protein K2H54_050506 [Gekko kuhli]